jgi:hypothetical protein
MVIMLTAGLGFWMFPEVKDNASVCGGCHAILEYTTELSPIVSTRRYNIRLSGPPEIPPGHQHDFSDPQGGNYRNIPRWKLR